MAKYLVIGSYTADGLKGLKARGGTARVEASQKFVASAGGSLESFYFALGADDVYITCELPDNITAAAITMAAVESGMVASRTVALLTPEEIDRAAELRLEFQPPGS
jgi:uncharacterized protein with GYD domain